MDWEAVEGILLVVAAVVAWKYLQQRPTAELEPAPPKLDPVMRAREEMSNMAMQPDPWAVLRSKFLGAFPESLHVGYTPMGGWTATAARSNMLILGPPSSGKTSGVLVPQILLAAGPVVASTTKGSDLYEPTWTSRQRLGKLWHFNPSGEDDVLPHCTELRWSPLTDCDEWDQAVRVARGFTDVVVSGTEKDNHFFRKQAERFLSTMFHGTALAGEGMEFLLDVVAGDSDAMAVLERAILADGGRMAVRRLTEVKSWNDRTMRDIRATAQIALDGYSTQAAIDSTKNPNFNPVSFVCGRYDGIERIDTIYITAPTQDQELVAPVIVAFLSLLRRNRFDVFEFDRQQGFTARPPMFWALDELSSMAPIRNLPSLVSQSASTGLFISVCLQDLSQAQRVWGEEGKGFPTLFRSKVIFPGIVNKETLDLLASLGGKVWVEKETWSHSVTRGESYGLDDKSRQTSWTLSNSDTWTTGNAWFLVDATTPADVFRGRIGHDDYGFGVHQVIYVESDFMVNAEVMPYYSHDAFVAALECNKALPPPPERPEDAPTYERRYESTWDSEDDDADSA